MMILDSKRDKLKAEALRLYKLGVIDMDEAVALIESLDDTTKHPAAIDAKPGRVFAYVRVSTEEQKKSGYSLESQERLARAYYEYLKAREGNESLSWGRIVNDAGVSAWDTRLVLRPQGRRLNAELQPGDIVLFAKLDRGFRDTQDFLATHRLWARRGVNVVFLDVNLDTSTANGRLCLTMLAAIAEWESAIKSERVLASKAEMVAQGLPTNGKAFGKKRLRAWNGRLGPFTVDRKFWQIAHILVQIRDGIGLYAGERNNPERKKNGELSWRQACERLELILAAHENRPPVPLLFRSTSVWRHPSHCRKAYLYITENIRVRPVL